jgi:NADH-quinone oxidoreductase subunit G
MELKINNQVVEAEAGELLLQVALRNGIDIPHFCYHPCLSVAGNCRICLVKVEGQPKLAPSCNLTVAEGMEVSTDSQEVQDARRDVMQFILNDHPVDCGICDKAGECRLQEYQVKYGEPEPLSLEKRHSKPKFYDLSPRIQLDAERCILCSRCVRFTQEISGSKQLGIVERGHDSRVERMDDKPFDDAYSDNVITNCPVGALLSRDFMYQSRVWYLEPVRSVCTGCARCCSVQVWRRKDEWCFKSLGDELNRKAYRITPLQNDAVNGPWLCNKGFDLHKFMARDRALSPLVGGFKSSPEEILSKALTALEKSTSAAVIVSAHASNEELLACQQSLQGKATIYTRKDCQPQAGEVVEDDLLIRADKNPNGRKAAELFGDRSFDPSAGHDLVIVWGDNVNYDDFNGVQVIHLGSFIPEMEKAADLFVPISTLFERRGTFTNFDGVENRFEQVFDKPLSVLHAEDFFRRLGE